ncbi:Aldehyde/histidinol dehydrogenase [Phascolomyces articulosus]|uniref:Aldehyde/histidinol dehydrogenase n=1 Tax=Phascolomyces articulosus TaxID=60185 RepID=A0AAD5PE69_9FUNG|nr:Aldehyde/histidinol dehydrogenase [Phascolomyces articulosus]
MISGWKLGPALCTGNVIILKTSELTPLSTSKVAGLIKEAGFSPGVINIITGYDDIAGDKLARHPKASSESNSKNLTLNLRDKSPTIIFDNADLDQLVSWAHIGAFFNQGRCCYAARPKLGDPFDQDTFQGPQISKAQFDRIMNYFEVTKEEGATGYMGENRVVAKYNMKIMQKEAFSPVVAISKFRDIDDAIEMSHDTKYGLIASVFTQDISRAVTITNTLETGIIWVNCCDEFDYNTPFGGYKQSAVVKNRLANINAIRSTIAVESTSLTPEKLAIKHNALCYKGNVIVDFNAFDVQLDPRVLTITPATSTNTQEYDIKLVLSKPIGSSNKSTAHDDDLKTRWTARELSNMQGLACGSCQQRITSATEFQAKDLPSEHWYELVECWICHEAKPEEHRARMQPISARPKMVLAGATYLLLHPQDLLLESFTTDDTSNIKWDIGLSKKWISIHCSKCEEPLGEGQYEQKQEGGISLLAAKFYKYCIALLPAEQPFPTFLEFLVYDLFDAAKAHATYRFLIQGRKNKRIYALLWLFNWDTHIIYNQGFMDANAPSDIYHERVMKVFYIDCTQKGSASNNDKRIEMWSKDKTADHLIYPESCCELLLETLKHSTKLVPPHARTMNNPAMALIHNFSVGFIKR